MEMYRYWVPLVQKSSARWHMSEACFGPLNRFICVLGPKITSLVRLKGPKQADGAHVQKIPKVGVSPVLGPNSTHIARAILGPKTGSGSSYTPFNWPALWIQPPQIYFVPRLRYYTPH